MWRIRIGLWGCDEPVVLEQPANDRVGHRPGVDLVLAAADLLLDLAQSELMPCLFFQGI